MQTTLTVQPKQSKYTITHWFQPIYNLNTKNILGYEALLRDASHMKISPVDIFKGAEIKGDLTRLDLESVKSAVLNFKDKSRLLFINIFPSTIQMPGFLDWWDENIPQYNNIVLELLEYETNIDWERLNPIIRDLKSQGVKIAVDDFGCGNSCLRQWIELEPNYIKLDKFFSKNLFESTKKQKTVRTLVDLLSDSTKIIIEGVETGKDLLMIKQLGIKYAQGYLLGKPRPLI